MAVEIKWRSGEGGAPASESCRLAARHPSQLWRASPRPPPAPLAEARPGPRAEPGRRAPPPGSSRPRRLRARRRSHVGSPPKQGHEARATAAPGGLAARAPGPLPAPRTYAHVPPLSERRRTVLARSDRTRAALRAERLERRALVLVLARRRARLMGARSGRASSGGWGGAPGLACCLFWPREPPGTGPRAGGALQKKKAGCRSSTPLRLPHAGAEQTGRPSRSRP